MKEESLPSKDKIIKGISVIESTALDSFSYDEIKKLFIDALGMVPKLVIPDGSISAPIFRVTNGAFFEFDQNKISSFSHPPLNYCRKGRANLDGFPVFYAALSGDTALREFRNSANKPLKKGDIVYISSWEVDKKAKFTYSQFIYDDSTKLDGKLVDLNKANQEKLAKLSSIYSEEKIAAFKLLMEKLSKFFIGDTSYVISSFLSHYILYEDRETFPLKIEAIMYPSVQAGFTNINFAIHPEFVKNHIKLKEVQKVTFDSFQKGKSCLNFIELGKPQADGTIKWFTSGFDLSNIEGKKYMVRFRNNPPKNILKKDHLFYSEKEKKLLNLPTITWSILRNKQEDTLKQLSQLDDYINYNKTYKKSIQIDIKEDEIYTEVSGKKYYLDAIIVELSYKLTLLENTADYPPVNKLST